jgi:hypothetical protein
MSPYVYARTSLRSFTQHAFHSADENIPFGDANELRLPIVPNVVRVLDLANVVLRLGRRAHVNSGTYYSRGCFMTLLILVAGVSG